MGYQEDTIDWQAVRDINTWLDEGVGQLYQQQPFAQDWARVAKIAEELGEAVENMPADATAQDYERVAALNKTLGRAISALISFTGQNPRKPQRHEGFTEMLDELADTAITAILAIQHFTVDTQETRDLIRGKLARIERRMRESIGPVEVPGA